MMAPFKEACLDRKLLGPWLSKPQVTSTFRNYFSETPTHFNQLHYMVMRNLLVRTGCGPSDAQVRELLTFMAELGIPRSTYTNVNKINAISSSKITQPAMTSCLVGARPPSSESLIILRTHTILLGNGLSVCNDTSLHLLF